jgi:hypothetical protein
MTSALDGMTIPFPRLCLTGWSHFDISVAEAKRKVVVEMARRKAMYFAVAGTMYWMNHAQRYTRAGKHPEYASRGKDKLGDLLRPEREISCITWGIHETREPLEVWEDLKLTK